MQLLRSLADLGVAASLEEPRQAVGRCHEIVREALGAVDAAIIYGGSEANFERLSSAPLPLTDVALWIVHREATLAGAPVAFDLADDGRVVAFRRLEADVPVTRFAVRLPLTALFSEMLVVSGHWPNGLGDERLQFVHAALAPVAVALRRFFESEQADTGREQVSAIGSIARLLSDTEDIDEILTRLCTIIAEASGIANVAMDVLDPQTGDVVSRALNETRYSNRMVSEQYMRSKGLSPMQREALRTRKTLLIQDVEHDPLVNEPSRQFFRVSLIVSLAVVPLATREGGLGSLTYASSKPLDASVLPFLEDLASQAALALRGIQMYRDLSASRARLEELNERLQESTRIEHHLARTDALTGIPNRRCVEEVLTAECERASREGVPLSISMADVDYFKDINDAHGHESGDDVLRRIAALARECIGAGRIAGRYGGDEFVFIMPGMDLDAATALMGEVRETVEGHAFWLGAGCSARTTVSFGVVQATPGASPEELLRLADAALYDAKHRGRNRVVARGGETPVRDAAA
ncbi:MAG: sensor domain-containing diguanylate cyclase [Dehalococcoidia bacterium]